MSTTPTNINDDVTGIVAAVTNFLTHRQVHKLGGTALAITGVVTGITTAAGWKELASGLFYAGLMHLTGGIKKVPDSPKAA
jgi:hypothetical protein